MSKYVAERRRFRFVEVLSGEPVAAVTEGMCCSLCKRADYALFSTRYKVVEASLKPGDPELGADVTQLTCVTCLKYIHKQALPNYAAQTRTNRYTERFADMIEWCNANPQVTATLPTLQQFMRLITEGRTFKPALVSHVSRLIHSLKTDESRLAFVQWIATVEPHSRSSGAQHLRFQIDAVEPLAPHERRQMEQLVARSEH